MTTQEPPNNKPRDDVKTDQYFSRRPPKKVKPYYGAQQPNRRKNKEASPQPQKTTKRKRVRQPIFKALAKRLFTKRTSSPLRFPLIAGVAVVLVFVSIIWSFTHKNAYAVYVGESLQGNIKMSKNVTPEYITNLTLAKIKADVNTEVELQDEITLKPVHASKKELSEENVVIGQFYNKIPYHIKASVISVDGVEVVTLHNDTEVEAVLERIAKLYVDESSKIVEKKFENATSSSKFVKPDTVSTPDIAFEKLNTFTETPQEYKVQSGDTLSKIASKSKMSLENLLKANEGLTANSKLKIGQSLVVMVQKPMVTVRTVEEVTTTDVEKKKTEKRENAQQHKSYSKVIQEGKDGQKEVVKHIVKLNGVVAESETKIVSEKIISEPVTEIVEVGTSDTIVVR